MDARQGIDDVQPHRRHVERLVWVLGGARHRQVPLARVVEGVDQVRERTPLGGALAPGARQREAAFELIRPFVPALTLDEDVREVEVGTEGRCRKIVLERELERMPEERQALLGTSRGEKDDRLRVERLREQLRQPQRLAHLERDLDLLERTGVVSLEEVEPRQHRRQLRDIAVGHFRCEDRERALHALERLLELA